MSDSVSISSGIAERYATAIFELARDGGDLAALETGVDALDAALKDSADMRDLTTSPVYSRGDQKAAMLALGTKMGLPATLVNALALMADKRRLFVLPQLISGLRGMIADHKGEVTADVKTAVALDTAQETKLVDVLKAAIGKEIKLNTTVDESLIGGLVVKVGSVMIDTSIAAKLNALQNTMKEVG